MQTILKIDGFVYNDNYDLNRDEFTDKFIEFVESQGWYFGGSIGPRDKNELD